MNNQRFSCSLDKMSKLITGYVIVFGLVLTLIPELIIGNDNKVGAWPVAATGGAVLVATFIFYGFKPEAYELSENGLTIERRLKPRHFDVNDIVTIRLPEEKELSWSVRAFGNGGLFGYTGRYYAKHIGSMIWFCTRRDKQVVVERKFSLPVIISPDEPAQLVWAWGEMKRPASVSE